MKFYFSEILNFLKNIIPFKVSIVSAVDGEKLSNKVISSHKLDVLLPRYPFNMRSAEIATFLSHRKCWQKIIDDKLDGAVIIEDDVLMYVEMQKSKSFLLQNTPLI